MPGCEAMERKELVEWIVILAIIVAWWPHVFLHFDQLWYHVLIYYVSPLALVYIFVRRLRRMQEGFEYSQKVVDARHKATGANVLGYPPIPTGTPEPPPAEKPSDNGDKP